LRVRAFDARDRLYPLLVGSAGPGRTSTIRSSLWHRYTPLQQASIQAPSQVGCFLLFWLRLAAERHGDSIAGAIRPLDLRSMFERTNGIRAAPTVRSRPQLIWFTQMRPASSFQNLGPIVGDVREVSTPRLLPATLI
jgi:hypothetical protein